MPAQRLEHRVDEQVLDLELGQVTGDEGLVVLPQPVGDLADLAPRDQQFAGGVAEGILHVPSGQATGVHLVDQRFEHLAVAIQKAHQRRPERLTRAAHLRHRDVNEAFGSAQPAPLIPVAQTELLLTAALVSASAAEEVALLTLQQLLHHQPGHRLHQRRDDVLLMIDAATKQPLQLLTRDHGRGYPSHRPAPSIVGPTHPT